jgi:hypothetical protein
VTRLLVLSMALWAAAAARVQADFTPAPSFSAPHPSVVRVVVPERDGASYGSGALVAVNESSGLIVTNWHVVRDAAGQIVVYFPDGFHSGAALLRVDREWDLAALAIWRPNVQPIAISTQAPRPGDALTIAGYGSGSYRAVTGQCTQYVSPGGNQPFEMIELAAPARNGDSGGPILNNRGELAGVLFGSAFGRTTGSYCGRLRWFLNSADNDFQRISSQALLAQQLRGTPPPVASISAAKPAAVADVPAQPARVSPAYAASTPSPAYTASAPPSAASAWSAKAEEPRPTVGDISSYPTPVSAIPARPAGRLPNTDQLKTILAAIGVLAVVYHALRLVRTAVG